MTRLRMISAGVALVLVGFVGGIGASLVAPDLLCSTVVTSGEPGAPRAVSTC